MIITETNVKYNRTNYGGAEATTFELLRSISEWLVEAPPQSWSKQLKQLAQTVYKPSYNY